MLHLRFIEVMKEADKVFSEFHPMPNTEGRSALYRKWRNLLDQADEIERTLGVLYEFDKELGWHEPFKPS
jgi:hypothetical protein